MAKRLQMNITPKAEKQLEELKRSLDSRTNTDTVTASLKIVRFLMNEVEKGNKIIIRDEKTKTEKVLLL